MSDAGGSNERNRTIARNEDKRQSAGDMRVSVSAIVFAIIIVAGVAWIWVKH